MIVISPYQPVRFFQYHRIQDWEELRTSMIGRADKLHFQFKESDITELGGGDHVVKILDCDLVVYSTITLDTDDVVVDTTERYYTADNSISTYPDNFRIGIYDAVSGDIVYISNPIEKVGSSCGLLIEICNSHNCYGLDFENTPLLLTLRIDGQVNEAPSGIEGEAHYNLNGKGLFHFSELQKKRQLLTELMPSYLLTAIESLSSLDEFYIDKIRYVRDGLPSIEIIETDPKYMAVILELNEQEQVYRKVHDDYPTDEDCVTTDNVAPNAILSQNDSQPILSQTDSQPILSQ